MYDEKKKMFEERWKKVDEGKKEMKQNLGSLTINDKMSICDILLSLSVSFHHRSLCLLFPILARLPYSKI